MFVGFRWFATVPRQHTANVKHNNGWRPTKFLPECLGVEDGSASHRPMIQDAVPFDANYNIFFMCQVRRKSSSTTDWNLKNSKTFISDKLNNSFEYYILIPFVYIKFFHIRACDICKSSSITDWDLKKFRLISDKLNNSFEILSIYYISIPFVCVNVFYSSL